MVVLLADVFISASPSTGGALPMVVVDWAGLGSVLIGVFVAGVGAVCGLMLIWLGMKLVRSAVGYMNGASTPSRAYREPTDAEINDLLEQNARTDQFGSGGMSRPASDEPKSVEDIPF